MSQNKLHFCLSAFLFHPLVGILCFQRSVCLTFYGVLWASNELCIGKRLCTVSVINIHM